MKVSKEESIIFEMQVFPSQKTNIKREVVKVLFLFDEPLYYRDKKYDEMTVMEYMADGLEVEATWCDIPTALHYMDEIKSKISNSDTIVFDYGGVWQASGLIDHWNRIFMQFIQDYSSKYWYCQSHIDTFDSDIQKELEDKGVVFLHSYRSKYEGATVGFRESFMSEEGKRNAMELTK